VYFLTFVSDIVMQSYNYFICLSNIM